MLKSAPSTICAVRLRVYSLVLLVAGFAVMMAACGGYSEGPALATQSPLSGQEPLGLLKHTTEFMRSVESFRAHADLGIEALGEDLSISMEMEVSRNNRMRNIMVIDTPDGKQTIEQVIAQPHVYTKVLGGGWLRLDLVALAALSGQSEQLFSDPMGFANSFFPAENIPWELYKVSSKGRDTIDGVPTEHLSIQFDFQELWSQLDSETQDLFGQSFGVGGIDVQEGVRQIEIKRLDFWVDGQGYNRKVAVEMLMGDTMSITMDMRMFNFDEEVVIDVPIDYSELPLS